MAEDGKFVDDATLYGRDLFLWTQRQARALAERRPDSLDWENLVEEIEGLGRSEQREIRSRLARLLQLLLKWEHQPERRSHSWQSTISAQRLSIEATITTSPSLKDFPAETLEWSFREARRWASEEMGVALDTLPESCPWALELILAPGFMPGAPWAPEDLKRD